MTNDVKYVDWMGFFVRLYAHVAKFEKKVIGDVRI